MTDTELIRKAYTDMYDAMIRKDREGLGRVLDDSFVLIHMAGCVSRRTNSYAV